MEKFSLSSKEEILQIGSQIPEEHQENYQKKFKDIISLEELTKARINFRAECKLHPDKVLEKGVCLWHTISHIHRSSQRSRTSNETYSEITADARYIQAAVQIEGARKNNQKTEELGRAILKRSIQDESIHFLKYFLLQHCA